MSGTRGGVKGGGGVKGRGGVKGGGGVKSGARKAIVRMIADGASIILADTPAIGARWNGWRIITGAELFPCDLAWQRGASQVHLWHPKCGPGDPVHDEHVYTFPIPWPAESAADAVAGFVQVAGDTWAGEQLAALIAR